MAFNEKLIELRKAKGWSQEELGYKLDVSRQTVSKWELSETSPEMNKLILLSNLFDITLDALITGKPNIQSTYYNNGYRPTYEYKSKKTFMGLPIVHINLGRGLRKAKGIIAIGTIATGVVSVGAISVGLISLGALSIGVLALGGFAAGLIALGGISFGGLCVGGLTFGYLAVGGCAFGVYSIGGCAIARDIAMGGYAEGIVAIGDQVKGTVEFVTNSNSFQNVNAADFKQAVSEFLPNTKDWIVNLFAWMLG